MTDEIWIVDDDAGEAGLLKSALARRQLEQNIRPFTSVMEATNALDRESGRFPLAVVSDLDTDESLKDGDVFLRDVHKRAFDAGTGAWTTLVSKHDEALAHRVGISGIPGLMHYVKDVDGKWAEACASDLSSVFEPDIANCASNDDLCPPLGANMEPYAPKDSIYVFSSGNIDSAQSRSLFARCPCLKIPDEFYGGDPVMRYRGLVFAARGNSGNWLAQQLLRWRILSSWAGTSGFLAAHLAGAAVDSAGMFVRNSLEEYCVHQGILNDVSRKKVALYSIGVGSFDNVTNDGRRVPELKRLSKFLFGADDPWDSLSREVDPPPKPLPTLPEFDSGRDGFFRRAHFVLDDKNLKALGVWKSWIGSDVEPHLKARLAAAATNQHSRRRK
jgi:hypothetical protein